MGFLSEIYVKGRTSIADLFRPGERCGVYVLHFEDGWHYAGQAVDVVRRYVQHRQVHADIERLSFHQVARAALDQEERRLIETLEKKKASLRNISLVSTPQVLGETDFDLVMSPAEQTRWLDSVDVSVGSDSRVVEPILRSRYRARYDRFMRHRHAALVLPVLQEYARLSLPVIRDSEVSFWSCTCLPRSSRKDTTVHARINIYWQEVFNVSSGPSGPLWFTWHLALAPLQKRFGRSLRRVTDRHPTVSLIDHHYVPGGQDQIEMAIHGSRNALRLIHDPDVLRAVREFNLRLLRKGPCTFGRYHCLDLADHLIE